MTPKLRGYTAMPQKSPAVSPVETPLFQLPIRSQERSPLGLLLLMLVLLVGGPGLGGTALAQDGAEAAPVDEAAAPISDDGDEAEVYRMEEGSFPVLSLLRFIQRTTGKFVNYPSAANDVAFAEDTTVDVIDWNAAFNPNALEKLHIDIAPHPSEDGMLIDTPNQTGIKRAGAPAESPTRRANAGVG